MFNVYFLFLFFLRLGAVESLNNVLRHPFILAINENENENENIVDFRYKIGQYLNISVRRLNELLLFFHSQNTEFDGIENINGNSGKIIYAKIFDKIFLF